MIGEVATQSVRVLSANDLVTSWVSNDEVLMPDEKTNKIWRINVDTNAQTLVGELKFSDSSTKLLGVNADEGMNHILVLASQHIEGTDALTREQLFLVDAACLAKSAP